MQRNLKSFAVHIHWWLKLYIVQSKWTEKRAKSKLKMTVAFVPSDNFVFSAKTTTTAPQYMYFEQLMNESRCKTIKIAYTIFNLFGLVPVCFSFPWFCFVFSGNFQSSRHIVLCCVHLSFLFESGSFVVLPLKFMHLFIIHSNFSLFACWSDLQKKSNNNNNE